jgi:hypothetical protein
MSWTRNSAALVVFSLLGGCASKKQEEETLLSIGIGVFLLTLVAFGIHTLLGKLAATDAIKDFILRRRRSIKVASWGSLAAGAALLLYGLQQEGVRGLFVFVGISMLIVGALVPLSVDKENKRVEFKRVGLFIICIYVLLFLIYQGHKLFTL